MAIAWRNSVSGVNRMHDRLALVRLQYYSPFVILDLFRLIKPRIFNILYIVMFIRSGNHINHKFMIFNGSRMCDSLFSTVSVGTFSVF